MNYIIWNSEGVLLRMRQPSKLEMEIWGDKEWITYLKEAKAIMKNQSKRKKL